MAVNKNGIVVLGAVFVDIKGFPEDIYVPDAETPAMSNTSTAV